MYSIDLNSDMGECFGAYKLGGDEASPHGKVTWRYGWSPSWISGSSWLWTKKDGSLS